MDGHIDYAFIGQDGGGGGVISFILICLMLSFLLMQMVIYLLDCLEMPSNHSPSSHLCPSAKNLVVILNVFLTGEQVGIVAILLLLGESTLAELSIH